MSRWDKVSSESHADVARPRTTQTAAVAQSLRRENNAGAPPAEMSLVAPPGCSLSTTVTESRLDLRVLSSGRVRIPPDGLGEPEDTPRHEGTAPPGRRGNEQHAGRVVGGQESLGGWSRWHGAPGVPVQDPDPRPRNQSNGRSQQQTDRRGSVTLVAVPSQIALVHRRPLLTVGTQVTPGSSHRPWSAPTLRPSAREVGQVVLNTSALPGPSSSPRPRASRPLIHEVA